MLKYGILAILSLLCLTVHSETIRVLQYNDTLCAKWNTDGSVCLQCAYRAFFYPITNSCENVSPECQTWNLGDGSCITCYDGYGDALTNGNAINGQCPAFNTSYVPSDPNCRSFIERGNCDECF
jgi:hypothetical protein